MNHIIALTKYYIARRGDRRPTIKECVNATMCDKTFKSRARRTRGAEAVEEREYPCVRYKSVNSDIAIRCAAAAVEETE